MCHFPFKSKGSSSLVTSTWYLVLSFFQVEPPPYIGKFDITSFIHTFPLKRTLSPNFSNKRLRIACHWLGSGHASISEPVTKARKLKCADWPFLDHMSVEWGISPGLRW